MKKKLLSVGLLLSGLVASAQTANVQVIHNAADPAASTVDVYLNGTLLEGDLSYLEATSYLQAPSETLLNIGIAPGNSTGVEDTLKNFQFNLTDGETYTLIANGELAPADPSKALNLFAHSGSQMMGTDPANTDLLVFHGSTDAPGVDITLENGDLVNDPGTGNVVYGDFRGYVPLPVADYSIQVRAAGTETVVKGYEVPLQTLNLGNQSVTVIASGYLNPAPGQPAFGLHAVLASGDVVALPVSKSELQIVHNASDAGLVDIYVNDELLLEDFDYRTASEYVEIDAGVANTVDIALAGSTSSADALFSYTDLSFMANTNYQVFANGLAAGTGASAFTLDIVAGTEKVSGSNIDVLVYHGVNDAPAVDVTTEDGTILGDAGNLSYLDASSYINLPSDDYSIQVRVAGTETVVKGYEAPLQTLGLEGQAFTVFASGILASEDAADAFGLFAVLANGDVVALPVSKSELQIVHNASDAGLVDIYVNDDLLLSDFDFREASAYVEVDAGVANTVDIALAGSTSSADALFSYTDLSFMANTNYQVFANGLAAGTGASAFTLDILEGTEKTSTSNIDVLVYHGSSDAPAVDVTTEDGTILGDAGNLSYLDASSYINLPSADYSIQVRAAGQSSVVKGYEAPLQTLGLEGQAFTVFASGLLFADVNSPSAFGLYAVLANGDVVALPVSVAEVQIVHNSSDAGNVDLYLNGDSIAGDVSFRSATGYLEVNAGVEYKIDIAPTGSADASESIFDQFVTLDANKKYIVFANGMLSPSIEQEGFGLKIVDDTKCTTVSGSTDFNIVHGSPDAPAVDVTLPSGTLLDGANTDDIAYNDHTDYISLPTDNYQIEVRADNGVDVVQGYDAPLTDLGLDGVAFTVFASGLLSSDGADAFGLFAVLCDGSIVALPETTPTSVDDVNAFDLLYNNPVVDVLNIQTNENVLMNIIDLNGQLVKTESLFAGVNSVNVSGLAQGTYVVSLQAEGSVQTFKLIKQ